MTAKRAAKKSRKKSKKSVAAQAADAVISKSESTDLLTLTAISQATGISYPTCVSYVKKHLDQIPHEGEGRKRRFRPQAMEVFIDLRGRSRRGPKGRGPSTGALEGRSAVASLRALETRLKSLEVAQAEISLQLRRLTESVEKPLRITVERD